MLSKVISLYKVDNEILSTEKQIAFAQSEIFNDRIKEKVLKELNYKMSVLRGMKECSKYDRSK